MTPQELFDLALSYYNGTDNIPQDYQKAYDLFLEAAEAGHIGSQSYLGRMLSMGEGVEKNYDEAVKWLKFAAEAGDADAQNRLGARYEFGQAVEKDITTAVNLYIQASEQGHLKALLNLSRLHYIGEGVEKDTAKAEELINKAAISGDPEILLLIGYKYAQGEDIYQDLTKALQYWELASEKGDIYSCRNIAISYYHGKGVEKNYKAAFSWYEKAAQKDDTYSQCMCGYMLKKGLGVDIDYSKAAYWYQLAADKGDADAQVCLAIIFEDESKFEQALFWFNKAANQNNAMAYAMLGCMYYQGNGVKKDEEEAKRLYLISAEAGYAPGQVLLGHLLYLNENIKKLDVKQAFYWYSKAAEQGHAEALCCVGEMYIRGHGVSVNNEEALRNLKSAVELGDPRAHYILGRHYYLGDIVEQDFQKAFELLNFSLKEGYTQAQFMLGYMYCNGLGVTRDYETGMNLYKLCSEEGSGAADLNIANLYQNGEGVEQNIQEAIRYFKQAISRDTSLAHISYSNLWSNGTGVEKNLAESYRILVKSSSIAAHIHISNKLLTQSDYLDYKQGVNLLKKVYREGFNVVCYNLGCAYYLGLGVPSNKNIAFYYWEKVKDEDSDAQKALEETSKGVSKNLHFKAIDLKTKNFNGSFVGEKTLITTGSNEIYLAECYKKAQHGDKDSFFNISHTLKGSTQTNDRQLAESYFCQAIDLSHPKACFLDYLYSSRESFTEIDFYSPYYLDELIDHLFDSPSEQDTFRIAYTVLKAYYSTTGTNPSKLDTSLSIEIPQDGLSVKDLNAHNRLYELCLHRDANELASELEEYLFSLMEDEETNTIKNTNFDVCDSLMKALSSELDASYELLNGGLRFALSLPETTNCTIKYYSEKDVKLASLIVSLYKRNNIRINSCLNQISNKTNIFIAFTRLRAHKNLHFDITEEQLKVINLALENKQTLEKAIILVDREFCSSVDTLFHDKRKELIQAKQISKIIEFPVNTFRDIECATSLLFIEPRGNYNQICFTKNLKEINVEYSTISSKEHCLNSLLYETIEKAEDEYEVVSISELVTINHGCISKENKTILIDDTSYKTSLLAANCSLSFHTTNSEKPDGEYAGRHILLKYNNGPQIAIYNKEQVFSINSKTYALKVNESKVTFDFLAHILLYDKELRTHFDGIVDNYGYFMPRDLLHKSISIPKDKSIQQKIVEDTLICERQQSSSNIEYNIVLVTSKEHILDEDLLNSGFNLLHKVTEINGSDLSFNVIYSKYIEDPTKSMVDAIIIDSDMEDHEDIYTYFNIIRERNIHLYLLSGSDAHKIVGSRLKEYFINSNRFFNYNTEGFASRLFMKMRDDLDSSNSAQAKIRNKHKAVFEAADALDKKYPDIGISKTVLRYIQTGCNIDDIENVSGPCGSFRNVCHKLLQVFISKKLVPDIDPGAIPAMLKDGKFYDGKNQRTYVLKEQFMSKYLSRALEYFCKVTNEGVHGSQDSSRLGTAALNILMEFIVWFYENDICSEKLDSIQTRPCYEDITDKIPALKGKVYTVKAQGAGKERYLYADNIHIKEDKRLKPGMKVKIKDVGAEMISDDVRRKIDDEYMVFYTSNYDIL